MAKRSLPHGKAGARDPGAQGSSNGSTLGHSRIREYPGGVSDEHLEEFAAEDGEFGVHNPANWGVNNEPHVLTMLNGADKTAIGLIAHEYRGAIQEIIGHIEAMIPRFKMDEVAANLASDDWKRNKSRELVVRHKIVSSDLPMPDRRDVLKSILALTALFLGDWALVAIAFQILGLSDTPAIPGLQFTDDLHLASLAAVVLLVLLAHGAGIRLRSIEYAVEARRKAITEEAKAKLPKPSWLDIALMGVFTAIAVAAVMGVAAIRLEYLATQGVSSPAAPFMAIQLAVLGAAIFVAFHFAHPFEKEWTHAEGASNADKKKVESCLGAVSTDVGEHNTNVELLDTVCARAGHHVRVDEGNLHRQHSLYKRRATLAQSEPTTEVLFAEKAGKHTPLSEEDLLAALKGVTKIPTYTKLSIENAVNHHEDNVQAVNALAARFERLELQRHLGDDVEDAECGSAVVSPINPPEMSEGPEGEAAA